MKVYTNRPGGKDFTVNFFYENSRNVRSAQLACPFFTDSDPIKILKQSGCEKIRLLVRLCDTTKPKALVEAQSYDGVDIRFFTSRDFHAKFYILGKVALIGSANLTKPGLTSNRELSIPIGCDDTFFEYIPSLFDELWNSASVLTKDAMDHFREWHRKCKRPKLPKMDGIEPCSPETINVNSQGKNLTRTYLETFRSRYVEQLIPAYRRVEKIYSDFGDRHPMFVGYTHKYEIDRFLFWVKGEIADGYSPNHQGYTSVEIDKSIQNLIRKWFQIDDKGLSVDSERLSYIERLQSMFETKESLSNAAEDDIVDNLQGCAAFVEMLRFTKGGLDSHIREFKNKNSPKKIRASFHHLAFGSGDYVQRIYDCVFLPGYKLDLSGQSFVFELFGWINKDGVPPFNGRIEKALEYLGLLDG